MRAGRLNDMRVLYVCEDPGEVEGPIPRVTTYLLGEDSDKELVMQKIEDCPTPLQPFTGLPPWGNVFLDSVQGFEVMMASLYLHQRDLLAVHEIVESRSKNPWKKLQAIKEVLR